MSLKAITWAFDSDIESSSMKFVLVALADNSDSEGMAWPCIKTICRKTGLERKTVILALDLLEKGGFIKDSKRRKGNTRQVKVYQLACLKEYPNSPKNGTVPVLTGKSAVFAVKECRKRNTEPSVPLKEPGSPRNATRSIMDIKDRITAKYTIAEDIKNRFSSEVSTGRIWDDDEHKTAYVSYCREIKALNKQLATL